MSNCARLIVALAVRLPRRHAIRSFPRCCLPHLLPTATQGKVPKGGPRHHTALAFCGFSSPTECSARASMGYSTGLKRPLVCAAAGKLKKRGRRTRKSARLGNDRCEASAPIPAHPLVPVPRSAGPEGVPEAPPTRGVARSGLRTGVRRLARGGGEREGVSTACHWRLMWLIGKDCRSIKTS